MEYLIIDDPVPIAEICTFPSAASQKTPKHWHNRVGEGWHAFGFGHLREGHLHERQLQTRVHHGRNVWHRRGERQGVALSPIGQERKALGFRSRRSSKAFWPVEVWRAFRPYLIRLSTDFLVFVAIWLVLLGAHALTTWLPLGTILSGLLIDFHEAIVALTFLWLSVEAMSDIVTIRKRRR